jgi:hypothetical protein
VSGGHQDINAVRPVSTKRIAVPRLALQWTDSEPKATEQQHCDSLATRAGSEQGVRSREKDRSKNVTRIAIHIQDIGGDVEPEDVGEVLVLVLEKHGAELLGLLDV